MISLIVGNKGTGKTKRLIETLEQKANTSSGHVVCVEKGKKLTYDVTHKVRLIDTENYGISSYDELYSFIGGICAGDHDVTDICIDGTLKIGGRDFEGLVHFLDRLSALAEDANTNMLLTISCDQSELPDGIHHVAQII